MEKIKRKRWLNTEQGLKSIPEELFLNVTQADENQLVLYLTDKSPTIRYLAEWKIKNNGRPLSS